MVSFVQWGPGVATTLVPNLMASFMKQTLNRMVLALEYVFRPQPETLQALSLMGYIQAPIPIQGGPERMQQLWLLNS